MLSFNSTLTSKIISLVVAVSFLLIDFSYAGAYQQDFLRVPMAEEHTYNRVKEIEETQSSPAAPGTQEKGTDVGAHKKEEKPALPTKVDLIKAGLMNNADEPIAQQLLSAKTSLVPNAPNCFIVGISPMILKEGGALICNYLCLYDPAVRIGAVAHINYNDLILYQVLERQHIIRFIATDIKYIVETLEKVGVNKDNLRISIVKRIRGIEILDEASLSNTALLSQALKQLNFKFAQPDSDSDSITLNLDNGDIMDLNGKPLGSIGAVHVSSAAPAAALAIALPAPAEPASAPDLSTQQLLVDRFASGVRNNI